MRNADGIQVAEAIKALAEAGITTKALAQALSVHPTTVNRWRNGTRTPNARNLAALRGEVGYLIGEVNSGRAIAGQRQLSTLQRAQHLLTTEAERTRQARQLDELRRALLARGVVRSVTHEVDPFALVGDTADDNLFGVAA